MVTQQGFNALLKVVEEPPPHVMFIFATTEPEKVIATIRSRTHHYPFRLVPPAGLQRADLLDILRKEGVAGRGLVLPLVVRAGAGSVRDSLSVLDQLLAGSTESGVRYERAVSLLGYTDAACSTRWWTRSRPPATRPPSGWSTGSSSPATSRAVRRGRAGAAARPAGRQCRARGCRFDPARAASGPARPDAGRQATRFGASQLSRAADVVSTAWTELTGATSPRLQLELLCARVLLPAADGEKSLLARLERLEKGRR